MFFSTDVAEKRHVHVLGPSERQLGRFVSAPRTEAWTGCVRGVWGLSHGEAIVGVVVSVRVRVTTTVLLLIVLLAVWKNPSTCGMI